MNEILKKRIEEATYEDADGLYPRYFAHHAVRRSGFFAGAEYALSHQWISVEEVLPKNGENVFAIYSDNAYVAWFDETDKDWHELSEGQLIVPTHWMPIPKFETRKK